MVVRDCDWELSASRVICQKEYDVYVDDFFSFPLAATWDHFYACWEALLYYTQMSTYSATSICYFFVPLCSFVQLQAGSTWSNPRMCCHILFLPFSWPLLFYQACVFLHLDLMLGLRAFHLKKKKKRNNRKISTGIWLIGKKNYTITGKNRKQIYQRVKECSERTDQTSLTPQLRGLANSVWSLEMTLFKIIGIWLSVAPDSLCHGSLMLLTNSCLQDNTSCPTAMFSWGYSLSRKSLCSCLLNASTNLMR